MVRVVRSVPAEPRPPPVHQIGDQINHAGRGERVDRHRSPPIFERLPGLGVERPEKEGRRRDVDDTSPVQLRVRHTLAEVRSRRAQVPHRLRLPEGPQGLAGSRVDGDHLAALSRDGVKDSVCIDRG